MSWRDSEVKDHTFYPHYYFQEQKVVLSSPDNLSIQKVLMVQTDHKDLVLLIFLKVLVDLFTLVDLHDHEDHFSHSTP